MMPKNHTYQSLGRLGTLLGCPSTATIQPLTGQNSFQRETPQKSVRSLGSLDGVALLIRLNLFNIPDFEARGAIGKAEGLGAAIDPVKYDNAEESHVSEP